MRGETPDAIAVEGDGGVPVETLERLLRLEAGAGIAAVKASDQGCEMCDLSRRLDDPIALDAVFANLLGEVGISAAEPRP